MIKNINININLLVRKKGLSKPLAALLVDLLSASRMTSNYMLNNIS